MILLHEYIIGIIIAIIDGILIQFGLVLQKKVVNKYRMEEKMGKKLVKSPMWILGVVLGKVVSPILLFVAIDLIGNTLTPGLMAAGLVVLVLFSIQILDEKLDSSEFIGIFLMIGAVIFLSFSGMSVDVAGFNFLDPFFLIRLTFFTTTLSGAGVALFLSNYKVQNRKIKGIMLITISALGYAISNFWIAIMTDFFLNEFFIFTSIAQIILFVVCAIVLVVSNVIGILGTQGAFKYGQAANLVPISQVPVQVAPIFYFLFVFMLPIPTALSIILLLGGIALIIISSFLLSRRQEEIGKIKLEEESNNSTSKES